MNNEQNQNNQQQNINPPGTPQGGVAAEENANFVTPEITHRPANRTPPPAPQRPQRRDSSDNPRRLNFDQELDVLEDDEPDAILTLFYNQRRRRAGQAAELLEYLKDETSAHGKILGKRSRMIPCKYDPLLIGFKYFREDEDDENQNHFNRPRLNF